MHQIWVMNARVFIQVTNFDLSDWHIQFNISVEFLRSAFVQSRFKWLPISIMRLESIFHQWNSQKDQTEKKFEIRIQKSIFSAFWTTFENHLLQVIQCFECKKSNSSIKWYLLNWACNWRIFFTFDFSIHLLFSEFWAFFTLYIFFSLTNLPNCLRDTYDSIAMKCIHCRRKIVEEGILVPWYWQYLH